MKRIALPIFLSLLLTVSSMARDLSLDQAFEMARDHSHSLKKEAATRDAYMSRFEAAVAERYPTLDVSSIASYKDVVPELEIAIPGGPSFTRDFGTHEVYQTDIRLKLPIYTGGKISGNIDLGRSALDMHDALLHLSDAQLALSVRLAYLALDHADRIMVVSQAAVTRVKLAEMDVQSLFGAGMADSVAILETRKASNDALLQLKSTEINRRQREIELITLLGLDPQESLTLTSKPTEPAVNALLFGGVSPDKPDLQAALAAVNMNRAMVDLSHSDYLPTVALFGGWSYGKPNIDPFHNEFNDYFTFGATLNWSLNLGFKTSKNSAGAKSQLEAAEHEYDRINELLHRDARLAFETVRLADEQYQISKQNRAIAQDNYRLAQSQYHEGTLASNRLLDIEAALTQAESSLDAARTNYHAALSRYLYLIGSDKLKEGF